MEAKQNKSLDKQTVANTTRTGPESFQGAANQEYEFVDVSKKQTSKSSFTRKIKVLIISYFDYGLPQIGDILTRHGDVFYLNEPLYPFDSASLKDGEEPISRRYIAEAMDYLTELFDCKIFDSKFGYSDDILKRTTRHAYSACNKNQRNVTDCVEAFCMSKKIVMSKIIRVYLQDLQSFIMRNRGKVKVLIIQRDPRINLHQHNKKFHPGWTTASDMFFQGRGLCSRMLHDVQTAKRLEGSGNSNFYRVVLYEHFLKSPEVMIKNILSFIGVEEGSEKVKKMLRNSNAQKDIRKAKLSKWDSIPDDDAALSVDKACAFFYKNSLYNPMKLSMGFVQRYNLCQYCD
ncbi:LOW QUALITY PROTEIN: carbohydrate sulfotransferase 1-like [Uloborus diversus]|uniref:LOW QUALITY PROTEIN: carbohydrate sulfotransferase 1-like n=1 Tax=Uloborus diversus TaxID=327109 RepID=UPI0024099BAD|nr:LOW QUALITY PROTEIN: carbohydrate sulfotransferase 1-like [Uloborus diversus]